MAVIVRPASHDRKSCGGKAVKIYCSTVCCVCILNLFLQYSIVDDCGAMFSPFLQ